MQANFLALFYGENQVIMLSIVSKSIQQEFSHGGGSFDD